MNASGNYKRVFTAEDFMADTPTYSAGQNRANVDDMLANTRALKAAVDSGQVKGRRKR